MEIWTAWVLFLSFAQSLLVIQLGVSEPVAIILLTAAARLLLMPISLKAAYQGEMSRRALEQLKPELQRLKESFKGDPAALAAQTMHLYRSHGINPLGRSAFLNIGTQAAFGLGMFQWLSKATTSTPFLWIANLAKPDIWLTVLVSALMVLGMALMPGLNTEMPTLMILAIPVVVAVIAIATLPASIGLYWAVSNAFTIFQTLVLRVMLPREAPVQTSAP